MTFTMSDSEMQLNPNQHEKMRNPKPSIDQLVFD